MSRYKIWHYLQGNLHHTPLVLSKVTKRRKQNIDLISLSSSTSNYLPYAYICLKWEKKHSFHWFDIIIYHYHFQPKKLSYAYILTSEVTKPKKQTIIWFHFIDLISLSIIIISNRKIFHTRTYKRVKFQNKKSKYSFHFIDLITLIWFHW